jgi:hypothetical protein
MKHAMRVLMRLRAAGGWEVIKNSSIETLCLMSVSFAAAADGLTYSTQRLSAAEAEHVLPEYNVWIWVCGLCH